MEHPTQDVVFCAGKCFVALAGAVDGLFECAVRPMLQYDWKSGLFIGKLLTWSFTRPGAKA